MAVTNPIHQPLRVAVIVPAKKFRCLGSMMWVQRYGPLQVASVAHEAGYFVRLFNEEIGNHLYPEKIASDFDVVGFSAKTSAITRAEELAEKIKSEAGRLNRHIVVILGGEHASMVNGNRNSYNFDYVLPGESEQAFIDILDAIQLQREGIQKGINFTPPKGFYQCQDFNNVPDFSIVEGYGDVVHGWLFKYVPLVWSLRRKQLPFISFQRTRGCPYNCSFCPTPTYLQGRAYRHRNIDSSIEYLKKHISKSGIRRVMFEDPTCAMPFDAEAYRFFDSVAKSSVNMKATVLARPDLCQDEKLLKVMKTAGVSNICIGIESLSDETRRNFKKGTTSYIIAKSIDEFHRHGFSITGLFIVGNDTDNTDCFAEIRKFIDHTAIEKWRLSPLSQLPEVPNQFLPVHRVFFWDELSRFGQDLADYINGEFVIMFPKKMKLSTLQEKIEELNSSSTSWAGTIRLFIKNNRLNSVLQRIGNNIAQKIVQKEVIKSNYIQMLKEIEKPFYTQSTANWVLKEDLLIERYKQKNYNKQ